MDEDDALGVTRARFCLGRFDAGHQAEEGLVGVDRVEGEAVALQGVAQERELGRGREAVAAALETFEHAVATGAQAGQAIVGVRVVGDALDDGLEVGRVVADRDADHVRGDPRIFEAERDTREGAARAGRDDDAVGHRALGEQLAHGRDVATRAERVGATFGHQVRHLATLRELVGDGLHQGRAALAIVAGRAGAQRRAEHVIEQQVAVQRRR